MGVILHAKKRSLPATIVCNPEIMGGVPTIRGTRIPVAMILVHLRAGYSRQEIYSDYPTLALDGIEAVITWAEQNIGPHWRDVPAEAGRIPILVDECLSPKLASVAQARGLAAMHVAGLNLESINDWHVAALAAERNPSWRLPG